MRLITGGPLLGVALTSAFVLPDPRNANAFQSPLTAQRLEESPSEHPFWLQEHAKSITDEVASGFDFVVDSISDTIQNVEDAFADATSKSMQDGHSGHDWSDYTIYQIIQMSPSTKRLAKLIDNHPDVVRLLNSTDSKSNYTLFAPLDSAFDGIPDHGDDDDHKPSDEFIEALLQYHVGIGEYPAKRILTTHTLPTVYEEKVLGGEKQRIRTSVGLGGVRLNFYSKVVEIDYKASNGYIHGIKSILIPPPYTGRILNLFPSTFSTLLLAMEKTDYVSYIHKQPMVGSTTFAPSNGAFTRLGPKVNAFLFNTKTGNKYLKAILKYHTAPNVTVYTDAVYDSTNGKGGMVAEGNEHLELKTLLDGASVGVDVATWGGFVRMKVNGFAGVSVTDGIAKNGVIQVVDSVLIPPHKHRGKHSAALDATSISVEELKERFADYL